MNSLNILLYLVFAALIVLHLSYSIDYSDLYTTANKGGATGVLVSVLGILSLWLSSRYSSGEEDLTAGRQNNEA